MTSGDPPAAPPAQTPPAATVRRVPEQHATIQAALDAAHAGDTVRVAPGTYGGPIAMRVARVTLLGTEGSTIVEGTGPIGLGVHADSVLVRGLAVRGFATGVEISAGGYRVAPRDVVAESLTVFAMPHGDGVRILGGTAHRVRGVTVLGTPRHGVLVAADRTLEDPAARGHVVTDNTIAAARRAAVAVAGPQAADNCAARNGDGPMAPLLLTYLGGCDRRVLPIGFDVVPTVARHLALAPPAPTPLGDAVARAAFGPSAMWWTIGLPLWGIGAVAAARRAGRVRRGLAQAAVALAATAALVLTGAWYWAG